MTNYFFVSKRKVFGFTQDISCLFSLLYWNKIKRCYSEPLSSLFYILFLENSFFWHSIHLDHGFPSLYSSQLPSSSSLPRPTHPASFPFRKEQATKRQQPYCTLFCHVSCLLRQNVLNLSNFSVDYGYLKFYWELNLSRDLSIGHLSLKKWSEYSN